MKNPAPYPLAYIQWHDSVNALEGWKTVDEAKDWARVDALVVHQIGWIIEETKEYYLVAGRYHPGSEELSEHVGLVQMIPKSWVKVQIIKS